MRFLWKLYVVYVALVVLSTVAVAAASSRWLEREVLDDLTQDLRIRASVLAERARAPLTGGVDAPLQAHLARVGAETGTRFTIIRADGKVVVESHTDPERTGDHGSRPEVLQARAQGIGTATRHSDTIGQDMMYVAVRVDGPGATPLGYVRAAVALATVDARLSRLRLVVFLGAAVAALVALVPGHLIARRVSEPLTTLTAVARERMDTITSDRNKLAAILSSMVEGVVAIDRDERIVHVNEVAARLLSTTVAGALGKPIGEVTSLKEIREALTGALTQAAPTVVEVRLRPPGAREQVLELHAATMRAAGGASTGAVVILYDVSELRRLETLRREFVANVSHELKTPLTAICGLTETLIDDEGMDPPTTRRFLEKIQKQSERLATLVRDLLTLSRVESEEASLEKLLLDLREPVRESFKGLVAAGEEKALVLALEAPDGPVVVHGDRELLRQLVDNLVDNAIKYTRQGGRICVRLRTDAANATLEVQDTGIGIAPSDQPRIFERFYRVDKARSRDLGGTGLGLSIVKHITLAHDGQVSIDSVLGEGSTFRVRLPLAPEGAAASGEHARAQPVGASA
jgi:two-component system phosphate regulon sensor histidine kinase PhoR